MAEEIRIYLCGPPVVVIDGMRTESALPGRQGRLLFAHLALNRGRALSRDRLMEALWPDNLPADAETSLSALLSKLRRALGADAIEGRSEVRLRLPASAWVDLEVADDALHRAESAIARRAWDEAWSPARVAVHIASRGFMSGHDAPWIDEVRIRVHATHLRARECYAETCLRLGGTELSAAERSARVLIDEAPHRESGYRFLMEALAARGDAVDALRVYEGLRSLLRDELGVAPSPSTQTLHARLLELCDDAS